MAARCEVGSQKGGNWQSALAARQAKQLNQIAAKWRTQLAKLCRAPLLPFAPSGLFMVHNSSLCPVGCLSMGSGANILNAQIFGMF
ncbi:hypothetical protein ACLKA6_010832 [Drosophila palustris]